MVRFVRVAVVAVLFLTPAYAQRPTCILQAVEKKLAEPARKAFMTKCAAEVQIECDKLADQRKLDGADRNYFLKHCVPMYVGPQ